MLDNVRGLEFQVSSAKYNSYSGRGRKGFDRPKVVSPTMTGSERNCQNARSSPGRAFTFLGSVFLGGRQMAI